MQMELRKIDGQNFIVQHVGKKELIRTPREALDSLVQEIIGHHEAIDGIGNCQTSCRLNVRV